MFSTNSLAFEAITRILRCRVNRKSKESPFMKEDDILSLISQTIEKLKDEPAVLNIEGEFNVVGDIHGNLDALLRFFDSLNYPPYSSYLFLGDYVDRGSNSAEVLFILFSLKILFPRNVYLLRGNHECESLTTQYEFRKECEATLGKKVYQKIIESFNYLPIAAILNKTIFCVHGGISPDLKSREDINKITKTYEDPVSGIVGDLLWTDFEDYVEGFEDNDRGCGYACGEDAVSDFLKNCEFSLILRSHQLCDNGYLWPFGDDGHCLTIFGSDDYMGRVNDAAVAIVRPNNEIENKVYHPLFNSQKRKRRITIPDWLIHELPCQKNIDSDFIAPERSMSEPMVL
ncbi:Serine/threonine-protein phosphatase PP1 [Tritrichomonas foetus]|uniref:Serine/threonine-protein phosphatase n=1 Tax=Tritrichomonas foetus TaxID=1144522 RepID=A0A1J4KD15_9EUKA|nr:Serine/threonine-protein phosphatase PP1 [Tritrichomonas foetus]|eukprot:OHT09107.1 Serine/threonine-protein phosphatase PP1 [Tritrichomonas foetus]